MPVTGFDQVTVGGVLLNPYALSTFNAYLAAGQTTGTLKWEWLVPFACTITDIRAALGTGPVGAAFIIDVNKGGVTLFTTQGNRPTIADGAAASSVTLPDIVQLAAGDLVTLDIDQVGSGSAGSNLAVAITVKRLTVP
jgi:hypothetical protein